MEHVGLASQTIGCVDGIIDGELRGWIVNLRRPGQSEQIICRNAQEVELAFCPFVYRDDVEHAVGMAGVFGFAIPLDLLAPLGSIFSVTDSTGTALRNGAEVALPANALSADDRGLLNIYLHIPKTAGTSLRKTLLRTVRPGEQLLIYPDVVPGICLSKFHQVPLRQRNRLVWIFGHCEFGLDRHLTRPCRYITFVREPMDRLRSNFAHHVAARTYFAIDGTSLRLTTVFNDGLSEECDNVMTRVLAGIGRAAVPLGQVGEDEVEIALTNVRRHFCFIGRQDRATADTLQLQSYLNMPPDPLATDNVTASHYLSIDEDSALDWDRITERNRADILLYNRLEQETLVSRVLK